LVLDVATGKQDTEGETTSLSLGGGDEARALSVLVSLLGLGLLDNQVIAPVLPHIASTLGTSAGSIGRTVSGYAVAAAIAALVVGPLSDRHGRKRFLVGAGVILTLGSFLVVLADDFATFALARLITGAAAGIVSALVVAAIGDLVPYERRGRAMGWVAVAYFAAPILGVPVAATLADRFGWRVNYVGFAVLGVVIALAIAWWLREAGSTPPVARRRNYGKFFKSVSTAAGACSAFFVTGGLTGFLLYLGAYLEGRFGLSVTQVGLVFLLAGASSLAGALAAGRIADRVGKVRVAVLGSVALAACLIAVPFLSGFPLYGLLGLVGLAAAARVAPLQSLVTELVSQEERGAYVALRNTLSQGGNATAAAVGAALYESSFDYVCWMTAGFSVAAVLLLLWIEEPKSIKGA
jgi:predicted MFS family arabinose efflux permease